MSEHGRTWALVLGAGDGTRLRALTTDPRGVAVPKQFCSLDGGPSLLRRTVLRAERFAPPLRIVTIVGRGHRAWWPDDLAELPPANIIEQPANRGTAAGILLPLLTILRRDPDARIVMLPSDHFVADEPTLARAIERALGGPDVSPDRIVLLGFSPDSPDTEYGWIVPAGELDGGLEGVGSFVEKPGQETAARLMRAGALWNSFVLVARGGSLLALFESLVPSLVLSMREALDAGPQAVAALYAGLEPVDFSKRLLQKAPDRLALVRVPRCGWTDLGTPARVAETLARRPAPSPEPPLTSAPVVLAAALARLTAALPGAA